MKILRNKATIYVKTLTGTVQLKNILVNTDYQIYIQSNTNTVADTDDYVQFLPNASNLLFKIKYEDGAYREVQYTDNEFIGCYQEALFFLKNYKYIHLFDQKADDEEVKNMIDIQNFKFQEVSGKLQFLKGSYIKNISDYKYSYWESSYNVYLLKLFYFFAGEIELRFWTNDNVFRGVAKFDLIFVDAQNLGANGAASIKITDPNGYVKIFVEAKKGSEGWLRITTPTLRRVSFYLGVRSFTGQNFEIQAPPLTTCPIVYNTGDKKLEWNITDNINVNLTPVETVIS